MTDVALHYYNAATEAWVDLTSYANAFHIEDWGIQKVGSATINLEGARSSFNTFLTNPYRLMRIQAKPDGTNWQNLFYGYIDVPNVKTIAGTITERAKVSLDCLSFEARLAQDYITFDYYKLQSAISPYVSEDSWTYRRMIEDYLAYPNSRSGRANTGFNYGTGFSLVSATDSNGIDRLIDGTGNWDKQTLFEANRISFEHIGYDGYYNMSDDLSTTTINIAPFSKSASVILTSPFIGEPEWIGGSLADVANMVFVTGGVDTGIPSDGDRWSEMGKYKYTPAIWFGETNDTNDGTVSVYDVSNAAVFDSNYQVNGYCVYFDHTDFEGVAAGLGSALHTVATLNISNTEAEEIDAITRCTELHFNLKTQGGVNSGYNQTQDVYTHLVDNNGNEIMCRPVDQVKGNAAGAFTKQYAISVNLNTGIQQQPGTLNPTSNNWMYATSSMVTFDWSHIVQVKIRKVHSWSTVKPTVSRLFVDGLQFTGGSQISDFSPLNPPAVDVLSISKYGVHPFNHSDSQITSFEQAQAEAARILNNLHEPIPTLQVRKIYGTDTYGTTWATRLRPSNVVTCQTVDYRVASVFYDWKSTKKPVEATYNLVTKTSPLPAVWSYDNTLRYLMK